MGRVFYVLQDSGQPAEMRAQKCYSKDLLEGPLVKYSDLVAADQMNAQGAWQRLSINRQVPLESDAGRQSHPSRPVGKGATGSGHKLEDLLAYDLRLVICGTAAGNVSAERKAYYAGTGNKFWRTLCEVGLTPRQLQPSEYRLLLSYGIGLTDLAKHSQGMDQVLKASDFDRDGLAKQIWHFSPQVVCFNGKKAATTFLDRRKVDYGLQPERLDTTRLFVAPSTSSMASGHWDIRVWEDLARIVREL